jgi:heterodisulfide reductase subunit C
MARRKDGASLARLAGSWKVDAQSQTAETHEDQTRHALHEQLQAAESSCARPSYRGRLLQPMSMSMPVCLHCGACTARDPCPHVARVTAHT